MANTIGWGKGTQNNSNGWGKFQNTIGAASIYEDSYSGETVLIGTSAAFSYSASSFHQGEADPTPTITGTTGGTFSATPSGLSINTSTGTIDLDNSTIQSYIITYTVSGVSANFNLAVTASPFIANNFSMQFDGIDDFIDAGNIESLNGATQATWAGWFKRDANGTYYLMSTWGATTAEKQFWISQTGTSISVKMSTSAGSPVFMFSNSSLSFNVGQFYHLAFVYNESESNNSNKMKLYINGVNQINSSAGSSLTSLYSTTNSFLIGKIGGFTTNEFCGNIDEVAIWNTALGETAIQEIYNATANNTGKVLDLNTDTGNYTSSANLQYWNRLGD